MKIEQAREVLELDSNFDLETKDFGIDLEDDNLKAHLYETLYNYSDPIGSIIREVVN